MPYTNWTFYPFVVFSQALAIAIVGWICYFERTWLVSNKVAWKFDYIYHPILMTAGFVLLQGEGFCISDLTAAAILIYRALSRWNKVTLKLIHAALHLAAIALTITGLFGEVVFKERQTPPDVHFHSLHEWTGLAIMVAYVLQWLTGFVVFLLPFTGQGARKALLPIHTTIGIGMFFLTIAQILSGMTLQSKFACKSPHKSDSCRYQENSLSLLMLLYTLAVAICVIPEKFRRVEGAQASSNTVDVYHVSTVNNDDKID